MGTNKQTDWGCLYLAAAPVVLALVAAGDGDWIIAGIVLFFVAVMLLVTIAEVVGAISLPGWMHRKRQP